MTGNVALTTGLLVIIAIVLLASLRRTFNSAAPSITI